MEIKRLKGSKIEKELIAIVDQHEYFKGSYFWTPPGNASGRRSYEKKYSREHLDFTYKGFDYHIEQYVSCSCKNVYYYFRVDVDDRKKDIRALKKLINGEV